MKQLLTLLLLAFILTGCTDNVRVKAWGGKSTFKLPKNQKLINLTWKESSLWILTKPMVDGDIAETYSFKEQSAFSVMEGEYIIIESK